MEHLEEKPLSLDNDQPQAGQPEPQEPEGPPWPTNGGPLGCLLGAMVGFLVGGFLGTTLLIPYRPVGITLTVLLTLGLAVAGWKIGRSIFREYKLPKPRRQGKQ